MFGFFIFCDIILNQGDAYENNNKECKYFK